MERQPQPIAHGSLERTPFAHVLVSLRERRLEGTLAIWAPPGQPGQDRLYVREGQILRARLLTSSSELMRGLLPLFRRRSTYAFYDVDLVGDAQRGPVDVRALVAAGLRGGVPAEACQLVFQGYQGQRLRIRRNVDLGSFDFIPKERAFLDMFRAEPSSIEDAITSAGSEKIARRVLYALAITKSLEVYTGQWDRQSFTELSRSAEAFRRTRSSQTMRAQTGEPPTSSPRSHPTSSAPAATAEPPSSSTPTARAVSSKSGTVPARASDGPQPPEPPAQLSAELQTRWREVADKARAIDDQTYFEMLGVDRSASPNQARDAYFQQVKRWHPDRLPAELEPLRGFADEIFQHLTSAHETLADSDERLKYLKSVQNGGGTPRADRQLEKILGAAMEFQKVEVLIRRREWARAEQLVRELLRVVPDEADYHAALGFILWNADSKQNAAEALASLDQALVLNESHERGLMTKAQILDRKGDKAGAIRLFERVAELYPKNVDAQRQVRLAQMRGTGSHPASASGTKKDPGLLGKLFGGKK